MLDRNVVGEMIGSSSSSTSSVVAVVPRERDVPGRGGRALVVLLLVPVVVDASVVLLG